MFSHRFIDTDENDKHKKKKKKVYSNFGLKVHAIRDE